MCDSSVVKTLSIIFKNYLQSGYFSNNWKKSNVVSIHKKSDKQLLQNYWPVSLLRICGKKFWRELFSTPSLNISKKIVFSVQINLVFNSCENQLLSIVHDIYANFDEHSTLEMRANFLDILKAFHKELHEGLLFKFERIGI